ncbi:hypothetical protein ACOMHN_051973 [Nucella lapillus]
MESRDEGRYCGLSAEDFRLLGCTGIDRPPMVTDHSHGAYTSDWDQHWFCRDQQPCSQHGASRLATTMAFRAAGHPTLSDTQFSVSGRRHTLDPHTVVIDTQS